MAESADTTIIGSDSVIKGEMSFQSRAQINGRFEGQITGKGQLIVAENATCAAEVNASGVQVDGLVEGNLNAGDRVQLNAKGTVRGDIVATKMAMAEGAAFYGMCNVGPEAGKAARAAGAGGGPGGAGGSGGDNASGGGNTSGGGGSNKK